MSAEDIKVADQGMDAGEEVAVLGLVTRNVFLDTCIYKNAGHDLSSRLMKTLADYITDGRVKLHISDITLSEIGRQLYDEAAKLDHELQGLSKKVEKWQSRLPHAIRFPPLDPEVATLAKNAFDHLRSIVLRQWKAEEHAARNRSAAAIFEKYFSRKAPFAEENSKEFPDAFVVEALNEYCVSRSEIMYVVTSDKALQAAAEATETLIPIESLTKLFEHCTAAETPALIEKLRPIIESGEFIAEINEALSSKIGWIGFTYLGSEVEGEVYDVETSGEAVIEEWNILRADAEDADISIRLSVPVVAEVEYEDYSRAMYDREDGRYYGTESRTTEIETVISVRIFVIIDLETATVQDTEIITSEVGIREDPDDYR